MKCPRNQPRVSFEASMTFPETGVDVSGFMLFLLAIFRPTAWRSAAASTLAMLLKKERSRAPKAVSCNAVLDGSVGCTLLLERMLVYRLFLQSCCKDSNTCALRRYPR